MAIGNVYTNRLYCSNFSYNDKSLFSLFPLVFAKFTIAGNYFPVNILVCYHDIIMIRQILFLSCVKCVFLDLFQIFFDLCPIFSRPMSNIFFSTYVKYFFLSTCVKYFFLSTCVEYCQKHIGSWGFNRQWR